MATSPTPAPRVAEVGVPPARLPKGALVAAPIVFVVTAVIGIVMIAVSVVTIADAVGNFHTVRAGRTATVRLAPGEWYVVLGGPGSTWRQVQVQVLGADGRSVTKNASSTHVSVDASGKHYDSAGSFDVSRTGAYRVTVDGPAGTEARIGQVPFGRFIGLLVGGIVIGAIGFIAAVVLLVVGLVVRANAKKRRSGVAAEGAAPAVLPSPVPDDGPVA